MDCNNCLYHRDWSQLGIAWSPHAAPPVYHWSHVPPALHSSGSCKGRDRGERVIKDEHRREWLVGNREWYLSIVKFIDFFNSFCRIPSILFDMLRRRNNIIDSSFACYHSLCYIYGEKFLLCELTQKRKHKHYKCPASTASSTRHALNSLSVYPPAPRHRSVHP